MRAFLHFERFSGEASLFTWLAAITLNDARARPRRRKNFMDSRL